MSDDESPPPYQPRPDEDGFLILPGRLDESAQAAFVRLADAIVAAAPFDRFRMPGTGRPFSVEMTNAGSLGWVADRAGYRYSAVQPGNGLPWPPIPQPFLDLWDAVAGYPHPPECCLLNRYQGTARLGLHRDEDEQTLAAPILNVSLGDTALFRLGGRRRGDPTRSFRVPSGTVMLFSGPSRMFFHGVDRILPGTSTLLPEGGRLNLTLRRVTVPG